MKKRIKKYYTFITAFFILIVVVLSVLLSHARLQGLELVKKQYNEQQELLAKQTALSLEENFAIVGRELELLANMCAVKSIDLFQIRDAMGQAFSHVKNIM